MAIISRVPTDAYRDSWETIFGKKMRKTPEQRWEEGIPHDPRAMEIYEFIEKLDYENGDCFGFKSGGDGDN